MANPMYGQNKADNALDKARNAFRGALDVAVAGDNTQFTLDKDDCCRTFASHHANGMDITLPAVSAADAGPVSYTHLTLPTTTYV